MHMHRSWQSPSLTQDRCICLLGQGRRAYAPILGSGWALPESVYVHSCLPSAELAFSDPNFDGPVFVERYHIQRGPKAACSSILVDVIDVVQ
eukprot:6421683-Pyramimonas_sp.AAC.1